MNVFNRIVTNFEASLNTIETDNGDVLIIAEKNIKEAKEVLNKVRLLIGKRGFKSFEEEIYFFKQIKPKIYSKLIYYLKLFTIESKRPRSSKKTQIKYFNSHIDKLQTYFNDNLEFYHYYRRGSTIFDRQYFTRKNSDLRLHPDTFHFLSDEQFSTSHDSTVAMILAYDMLIVYLKKEIDKLENKNNMEATINPFQKQSRLFWTANKTDLIELIYALQSSGAINSGTADIKEMATACELLFNIDLGDYYRTYLEIRSRKTNQTKFLDKMKDSLVTRMESADE